jgi:hypothetical protein
MLSGLTPFASSSALAPATRAPTISLFHCVWTMPTRRSLPSRRRSKLTPLTDAIWSLSTSTERRKKAPCGTCASRGEFAYLRTQINWNQTNTAVATANCPSGARMPVDSSHGDPQPSTQRLPTTTFHSAYPQQTSRVDRRATRIRRLPYKQCSLARQAYELRPLLPPP